MKQTKPPLMEGSARSTPAVTPVLPRATINGPLRRPRSQLVAGLCAVITATALNAQETAAPTLTPRVYTRPLTPTDKTTYNLPANTEFSGGLSTIGVGTPAYLEAQVNLAIAPTNILSVTWALTSKPVGSLVALTNNPLGTNIPIYSPSDAMHYQLVGSRTLLRPDLEGQYTVTATIATIGFGTTNVALTITAGTYLGWYQGCIACHSGGLLAPDMTKWTNTLHATKFSRSIDGLAGAYSLGCVSCHTVGYDTYPTAVNGGFDDMMTSAGWTFPPVLTNGNWASMQTNYPTVANVANIQCENCHGPGSKHLIYNGVLGNTNVIAINWDVGTCGQCHDASGQYIKVPEWKNSSHAVGSTTPSGPTRMNCVPCHTAMGYASRGDTSTNTSWMPITCVACHDPHDATNPHQLRTIGPVTIGDGTVIANAGTCEICMSCHHGRNGSATNNVVKFKMGLATWIGGSSFGPHDGPQTDLFMGANGITYGKNIPSSAHRDAVDNPCVTCHMQPTASTDAAFLLAGGHTFSVLYTSGATNIQMTAVCAQCHGAITNFNLVREDYNGDGIIEGVQTEVQHLLDQLSTFLPPDTTVKSSLSTSTNWTIQQLNAAYNWQMVNNDGSLGVHNTAYAVGLLKASITDLTGDPAGLGPRTPADLAFYAWQVQYFGSATSPNADPNASPAGDGIPNWLKYSLGLNPLIPGQPGDLGGIVWTSGKALGGNTPTNTVQIYTAAEIAFNTKVGTTYQVQAASAINTTWQNVSTNIPGTGTAVSFLTPTRQNVQQYYRVVHHP